MKIGRRNEDLVDWLPWLLPLDDKLATIMTSCGGLMSVARILPPDLGTASPEMLVKHHERLAATLARYGDDTTIWFDQWRTRSYGYLPTCEFNGNAAALAVDDSRRRFFTGQSRPVFDNNAFITIHQMPPSREASLMSLLLDRTTPKTQAFIDGFLQNSADLFAELRQNFRYVEVLSGDALASYLGSSVTYDPQDLRWPGCGVIASGLALTDWDLGERVRAGRRFLATVEVRNFGSPSPLSVDSLHELPFECRWVTTAHCLNPDGRRKQISEARKRWLAMQSNFIALMLQRWAGRARKNQDARTALKALKKMEGNLSNLPLALATANVHVWSDRSEEEALARAAEVVTKLRGAALHAEVATLNSALAPLADMPGALGKEVSNLRRKPEDWRAITKVSPVTGVSVGDKEDWRFRGPALLVGLTSRGVPHNWALNAPGSDFAHTAIVGETGGGKSTLIALIASQFLRYAGAKVILFDRGGSFLVTCLCLGGDWIELGGGGVGIQPLRAVHLDEDRAWAQGWVLNALRIKGMALQGHTDRAISAALRIVADQPPDERTLTCLHTYLAGDEHARQVLKSYLREGPYGRLFDGVVDSYGSTSVAALETMAVAGLQDVAPLLMSGVFRAIRRDSLVGSNPKLIVADEMGLSMAASPLFAGEIADWALGLRKLEAVLVLATQSLSHFDSPVAAAIWDQLGNKLYMAHAEAMRSESFVRYRAKGLLDEQIRALANATPKREVLLQTRQVTRLLDVHLEDEALAICGSGGEEHQARAREMLRQGIKPGYEFTTEWLAMSTREWAGRHQRRLELVA